jgi:hypothetical protein
MAAAVSNPVGSLDAANTLPVRLERIGVSRNFFAEYCGVSAADLSRCFTGVKKLDNQKSLKLDAALRELESLVEFCSPMPLRFDDVDQIRSLVRGSGLLDEENRERIRGALYALGTQS